MSSFFTVLFYPLKLLIEEEPNSFMRGFYLAICVVWYLFVFCVGHAIWQSIPVAWAFIVMVAKTLWVAYQWVIHWVVPPVAVLHLVLWIVSDSEHTRTLEVQEEKLTALFKDLLSSRMERVADAEAQRLAEIAQLHEALAQIEARLAKLEPVPIETVETMTGVMDQFVKGGGHE